MSFNFNRGILIKEEHLHPTRMRSTDEALLSIFETSRRLWQFLGAPQLSKMIVEGLAQA